MGKKYCFEKRAEHFFHKKFNDSTTFHSRFTMHGTSCGYLTEPGDVAAIPGGGYSSNVRGAWRAEVGRYLEVSNGISRGELLFTEEPLFLCLGRSCEKWKGTCFWAIDHDVQQQCYCHCFHQSFLFSSCWWIREYNLTPAMICLRRSSRAQCLRMVQEGFLDVCSV